MGKAHACSGGSVANVSLAGLYVYFAYTARGRLRRAAAAERRHDGRHRDADHRRGRQPPRSAGCAARLGDPRHGGRGAFLPLFLRPVEGAQDLPVATMIQLTGFCLQIGALISLRRCFGVLPADRGLVTDGLYGFAPPSALPRLHAEPGRLHAEQPERPEPGPPHRRDRLPAPAHPLRGGHARPQRRLLRLRGGRVLSPVAAGCGRRPQAADVAADPPCGGGTSAASARPNRTPFASGPNAASAAITTATIPTTSASARL